MKTKKLDPGAYKKAFDVIFNEGIPTITKDEFESRLESSPKSELFGVTVHYITDVMELENPGITDLIKSRVEETFTEARSSKFDFLKNFNRLLLYMSPVMPSFDDSLKYTGTGTMTWGARLDGGRVVLFIHGGVLTKRREGSAFNGILAHELTELQYVEGNRPILKRLPEEDEFCYHVTEMAVNERLYAIKPRYCIDLQQLSFDEYFKKDVMNKDVHPLPISLSAPLVWLPMTKHGDPAGKFLRKRVLDSIRRRSPKCEVIALGYEGILSKIPLYSPTYENYTGTVESMKNSWRN